jgi:alpha-beta hydrolase superfamily lysophospholipase
MTANPGYDVGSLQADRMSLPPIQAHYLTADGADPVFSLLNMPADGIRSEIAVLLCPPFGWDDVCSYRSRRDWAMELATSGHPTLRIDLPSSGDSGGSPQDPGRLAAWTGAVSAAASWLREATGCPETAAIGIGLGGLVICSAVAEGAPIDDLVLWAVPSRGRSFVRELRTFGRMEAAKFGQPDDAGAVSLPPGSTEAGGFLLSGETTRDLDALDVATLPFPDGRIRRALLVERDGISVDERLRRHLEEAGAAVTVVPGPGYGAMMAEPQEARPPREVFMRVEAWLDDVSSDNTDRLGTSHARDRLELSPTSRPPAQDRDTAELTVDGVLIRETPLTIEQPFGHMFGVLAEPVDLPARDLGAVLLNAGAIRHVGPNRMWVEIARRWASRGVPTLRLDLEGLGETDGDASRFTDVAELYVPELFEQARAALDLLEARCSQRRFVLTGLCSGAFWAFNGALRDERVSAAFMVNPRTLFWDASLETVRYLRRGLLLPSSWRMILRGEVRLARILAVIRSTPRSLARYLAARRQTRSTGRDELAEALDRLRDAEKHLIFIFSEREPFHEELAHQGRLTQGDRWPNIEVDLIPGRDHTLRPLYSQQRALDELDRALEHELSSPSRA